MCVSSVQVFNGGFNGVSMVMLSFLFFFSRFEPEGAYKKNAYKNMRKGCNGGKKQEKNAYIDY